MLLHLHSKDRFNHFLCLFRLSTDFQFISFQLWCQSSCYFHNLSSPVGFVFEEICVLWVDEWAEPWQPNKYHFNSRVLVSSLFTFFYKDNQKTVFLLFPLSVFSCGSLLKETCVLVLMAQPWQPDKLLYFLTAKILRYRSSFKLKLCISVSEFARIIFKFTGLAE